MAALVEEYAMRAKYYLSLETRVFRTEATLLAAMAKERGRTAPVVVLLDTQGTQVSSEGLAAMLAMHKADGAQLVVFAVGPADGWSAEARAATGRLLSLGPMTLPHELARVVLAEQVYRACTILAGHPYHAGH